MYDRFEKFNNAVYGTIEECKQKIEKISEHFDILFPGFFDIAYKSYSKSEYETPPTENTFFNYIEYKLNFLFILKKYYFDAFDSCRLEELRGFVDIFLEFKHQERFNKTAITKINNYKSNSDNNELNLSYLSSLFYFSEWTGSIILRQTFNKIPQRDDLKELFYECQNSCKDLDPDTTVITSENIIFFDIESEFQDDDYINVRKQMLQDATPKKIFRKESHFSKSDSFPFMFNLWYTYKTLTFDYDEYLTINPQLKNYKNDIFLKASPKEQKCFSTDCAKQIVSSLKNNSNELGTELGYQVCYILSCAFYFEQTDENLFNLIAYAYILLYAGLHQIDKLKDVPNEIKTVCFSKKDTNIETILNKISELINTFFDETIKLNSDYNLTCSVYAGEFFDTDLDDAFSLFGDINFIHYDLFPQIKKFFAQSDRQYVTEAEKRYAGLVEYLSEILEYKRKDLTDFYEDFIIRYKHQVNMINIYEQLKLANPVIGILSLIYTSLSLKGIHRLFRKTYYGLIKHLSHSNEDEYFDPTDFVGNRTFVNDIKEGISKHNKQENQVLKEIVSEFDHILSADLPIDTLMELRLNWIVKLRSRGVSNEIISTFDSTLQKIIRLIEDKASKEIRYDQLYKETKENLSDRLLLIKERLGYAYSSESFDEQNKKFFKSLVTGEYLYDTYVTHPEPHIDSEYFDYSCVALQYYAALEHLINFLFYIPYKKKILDPIFEENKSIPYGYIGETNLVIKTKLKDTLELGTFGFMYKHSNMFPDGHLSPNHKELFAYLKNTLNVSANELSKIAEDIFSVSRLRNAAAHGGNILGIDKAEEARKNVYEESIEIASKCRELIPQILDLFINKK